MTRPFVDRPVVDVEAARAAAVTALAEWGVAGVPELLRVGMNALFTLPGAPVVLRVGHATAPAAAAHALVAALVGAGTPTAPPIAGWAADLDEFAVTGWERVRETRQAIAWERVGAAVRAVHSLPAEIVPATYPCPSPTSFPWWDFAALLGDVGAELDTVARRAIEAAIERNSWWSGAVGDHRVVCHGDVHPGNVLTSAGGPLLTDWDLLCRAGPAWDHAALVTWADRWGADRDLYPRFAEGYGRSYADDPLALALGELRNVAATLMRVRAGLTNPVAAAEAERRLRYWRGDPDAPMWTAQ